MKYIMCLLSLLVLCLGCTVPEHWQVSKGRAVAIIGGEELPLLKLKDITNVVGHGEWGGLFSSGSIYIGGVVFAYKHPKDQTINFVYVSTGKMQIVYEEISCPYVELLGIYTPACVSTYSPGELASFCTKTFVFHICPGTEADFLAQW